MTSTILLEQEAKPTRAARRRVIAASGVVALGASMLLSVPCLAGTTTTRITATTTMVSALCVQPTSVGWLCKEIIKIFRLRRSAGPTL